ncbi:MAG: L-serine ammonia-lyase, iron-sulfur-dependent, subunit alpha [Planctomycetota bacterium]
MKLLPSVQPSRGCTEPVAIALAAALAARAAGGDARRVVVACDRNTLKNAQAPGIPGTGGLAGADLAAALGALAGDPERGLEVLAGVGAEDAARAQALLAAGAARAELAPREGPPSLWVEARVEGAGGVGLARLADTHTNVVALERDGAPQPRPAWASAAGPSLDPDWKGQGLAELIALADALDAEDEARLLRFLALNVAACGARADAPGEELQDPDLLAGRGSLARMTGQPVTVVTSGFSGNQGLVATIPVWALARELGVAGRPLAQALAQSHLVGSYLRSFTGVLSPLCNAVHAASAGAAAGCVRLLGGELAAVELACKRVLAAAGGVVCDGAKPECSLKVELGAAQALRAARLAARGGVLDPRHGLAGETLEETARNLARLAHPALARADEELLQIALRRGRAP